MDLGAALSIATSGLASVQGQIAVVSQNVANANTAGYAEEIAAPTSMTAAGQGSGVRLAPTVVVSSPALQTSLYGQNAAVAYQTTMSTALSAVTAVEGSTDSATGSDGSLTSLTGALQTAFTSLGADPSNNAQQQTVVDAASSLVSAVQSLAGTYATERQAASDGVATTVATINQSLSTIGSLSSQIVALKAQGLSTADLENQRGAAMTTLSGAVGVRFQEQPNGNMLVSTTSGLSLPTNVASGALAYSSPTLAATSAYGASPTASTIPAVTLGGVDVTASLTGGTIGADIQLRDVTLPTDGAELDSFAATVAQRFDAQGLTLFTDANGNVPAAGTNPVGFSTAMTVNGAVVADPTLVRDGTHDVATGDPSGAASFTSNPAGGPAGFTTLIDRVVQNTFGSEVANGVAQPVVATSGLGTVGTLSLRYDGTGSLTDFAGNLVAAQGADSADATAGLTTATGVQTALQGKLSDATSVSVDSEMATMTSLQNSYSANAKVIAAVQSMFGDLLDAVDPA